MKATDYALDHAIQLNNEGVRQTVSGSDKQAVLHFSKALSIFESLICLGISSDKNELERSVSVLHKSKTPLPKFGCPGYFHFNNLISLTRIGDYNAADSNIYCSAILINIAFVYHRQAVQRRQPALLVKAARFYERVIKIVSDSAKDRGTGVMVRLAAINNLSHIRFQRGEGSEAATEGLQLFSTLVKKSPDVQKLLNSREIKGVMSNVISAKLHQSAAIAA